MTADKARARRFEARMARLGIDLSPAEAWAAIINHKGGQDSVWHVCRTCLPELQDAMVGFGHLALEAKRAGLTVRFPDFERSVLVLAQVIAIPPGEAVPDELHRTRPVFDPDLWHRMSRKDPDRTGYQRLYRKWALEEITWCISRDPDATELRRRFHTGPLAGKSGPIGPEALEPRKWVSDLLTIIGSSSLLPQKKPGA